MKADKEYVCKEGELSLEFMRDILKIADQANEMGSDQVEFDIGPLDGITLTVGITFTYKGLEME